MDNFQLRTREPPAQHVDGPGIGLYRPLLK